MFLFSMKVLLQKIERSIIACFQSGAQSILPFDVLIYIKFRLNPFSSEIYCSFIRFVKLFSFSVRTNGKLVGPEIFLAELIFKFGDGLVALLNNSRCHTTVERDYKWLIIFLTIKMQISNCAEPSVTSLIESGLSRMSNLLDYSIFYQIVILISHQQWARRPSPNIDSILTIISQSSKDIDREPLINLYSSIVNTTFSPAPMFSLISVLLQEVGCKLQQSVCL